jgi:hypothetical protein
MMADSKPSIISGYNYFRGKAALKPTTKRCLLTYPYPPAPKKSNKTWMIVLSAFLGVCLLCGGIAAGAGVMTMLFGSQPATVANIPRSTPPSHTPVLEATQSPANKVIAPTPTKEEVIQPEQPTETPPLSTSAPQASRTYTEDFSTTNGAWPEVTTDNYEVGYSNMQNYSISLLQPNRLAYVVPPHHLQEPFMNVIVSVNVRPGLQDGAFGILCGFQDANNFYAVKVSGTQYSIYKVVQGKTTFLTDPQWKPTDNIQKLDNNGYINLLVNCMGSSIGVQINNFGQKVVMDDANSFPTGDVAIFAASGTTKGYDSYNTIFFDDFSLEVNP